MVFPGAVPPSDATEDTLAKYTNKPSCNYCSARGGFFANRIINV